MAVNHVKVDSSTPGGARLRQLLTDLERVLDRFSEEVATMDQMKDSGEIGQYLADQYGFGTKQSDGTYEVAAAQAGYAELASAFGKIKDDSSVDHVQTALRQVCSKLR